jgi:hypothetical protein
MEFTTVAQAGQRIVEGRGGKALLRTAEDTNRLIEACWFHGADAALLHAANLPPGFFDLSTGVAGAVLQKLQNYRIRLAVVCEPQSMAWSARFNELLTETQHSRDFGVFTDRSSALAWLAE